jgi:preprotein translocase subunit SecE
MIEKVRTFLQESLAEMKKVTWPDRKTTAASTAVVLGVSVIVGIYLGLLDVVLSYATDLILK